MFGNTKISDQKINQAGLGIGLTVSYMICRSMGGQLTLVSSQQEVGTKFSIILPIELLIDQNHTMMMMTSSGNNCCTFTGIKELSQSEDDQKTRMIPEFDSSNTRGSRLLLT